MSKEQAKGFFEAISRDKQLAEEVKDVMGGQATNQEKAKELLSLAKAHNFKFTEDELKTSLSIDDLADVSGGMWSALGSIGLSVLNMFGFGGGGNQPAPQPETPMVNAQKVVNDNAQNKEKEDNSDNSSNPLFKPIRDKRELDKLLDESANCRFFPGRGSDGEGLRREVQTDEQPEYTTAPKVDEQKPVEQQ